MFLCLFWAYYVVVMNKRVPQDIVSLCSGGVGIPTVLLVAFEGWNDAGEAASECVRFLEGRFGGRPVDIFDAEPYYSFVESRPVLETGEDGLSRLVWPGTRCVELSGFEGVRVLVLCGAEPSLRWSSYVEQVYAFARAQGVDVMVLLGSLLDDVPHTRPFPLAITSGHPVLLGREGVEPVTYNGPTGIVGTLAHFSEAQGIPAVSVWVSVPHYVAHAPQPKASFAVLSALETMLGVPLPVDDLAEDILAWERGAAELMEDEPELRAYVQQLESVAEAQDDLAEFGGVDIAAEFEKFLKRREGDS